MAIRPVSSVSFSNNYNNVNFEGKRKEKSNHGRHSTTPLKAVPLAVMLAMSPLNTVEAQRTSGNNGQVLVTEVAGAENQYLKYRYVSGTKVGQKDYPAGRDRYLNMQLKYLDKDNSASSVEWVNVSQDGSRVRYVPGCEMMDFNLPIRSLNRYRINVVGCDGKIGKSIGTTHAIAGIDGNPDLDRYIAREDVIEDLENFAMSSKNKAFPVKDIEMNVYPNHARIGFQHKPADTSWIVRTGRANTNYGERVFRQPSFHTNNGEYTVSFYSNDGNAGNYETVVITRDDGLRCKVDRLRETELRFETTDDYVDSIVVKCVDISDPTVGKFTIIDDILYNSLMTLKADNVNNNSIRFWDNKQNITLDENGIH